MRPLYRFAVILAFLLATPALAATHGLSLYGEPKYKADFKNLDYANPDAPKGGSFRLAAPGSFDSLNPFIVKGDPAAGLTDTFATLLAGDMDEPFSAYGYAAQSVELAPDRRSITFTLRPEATFHDGSPITAQDVVWSFKALRDHGAPFYRSYYQQVASANAPDKSHVQFIFATADNRELPLIVGQMPILSQKFFQTAKFEETTLQPILGSGPYKIESVDPGRSVTYKRIEHWWGENLPVNRGRHNFDMLVYDYYRDPTVAFEAFVAGKADFRLENIAKNWATAYTDLPAVKSGQIVRAEIKNGLPAGVQGFAFNLRRKLFQDPRVRRALGYALDFEWSNKTLAFGAYTRLRSYFDNTDLAAQGLPSEAELALLKPLKGQIPPEIFTTEYNPPKTDGSGNNRDNMKQALDLLQQAGWTLTRDGVLVDAAGKPFTFEIVDQGGYLEKWVQPYLRSLERLGIKASYRVIDSAQYQNRMNDFDFDVTICQFAQSLSPGNEQAEFWTSASADAKGSRNIIGIKNPAVDQLVAGLIAAPDRASLVAATRALDRVLTWNDYIVPHWYIGIYRIAVWNKFAMPPQNPPYGLALDTWWAKPAPQPKS